MTERGPGRPSSIDRRQLVVAALEIAGRHGFPAVSAREVAARLHVSPMAIYRHVSTMEHLRAVTADAALAHVVDIDPARDWRRRVRTFSGELFWMCEHYHGLESERVLGPQRKRIIDDLQQILRGGFAADDAVWVAQMILTLVVGHAHVFARPEPHRPYAGRATEPDGSTEAEHWGRLGETIGQGRRLLDDSIRYLLAGLEAHPGYEPPSREPPPPDPAPPTPPRATTASRPAEATQ